jgi:hypothetical protein
MKPVFLELFSGSGLMSREFEKLGWETVTVDIDPKHQPDYVMDVLDIDDEWVADIAPTMIWAGIDCSCFSVMTISRYWNEDGTPRDSNYGYPLLQHTIDLITNAKPRFFVIENPRAMMRTLDEMKPFNRYEVWYCQYGDDVAKPTDLFGKLPPSFYPRTCSNGNNDCNHQKAPRGTPSGIQGRDSSESRAVYPLGLCKEISSSVHEWIFENKQNWFSLNI